MVENQDTSVPWHNLLFGVRRSVRYHYRRIRFFDNLHRAAAILSALSGTATITALLAQAGYWITLTFAACVTFFSVIDLIIGPGQRARSHSDFARRYFQLEKQIVCTKEVNEENLMRFTAARLDIEADEPPPRAILNAICHNELVRACGYDESNYVKISWYHRLYAQFCDLGEHSIKSSNSL